MTRLNLFLTENIIDLNVDIARQEFEKMSKTSAEYALKIHYKEFLGFVKKNGSEKNIIDFVNRAFKLNIKSLDELDFEKVGSNFVKLKEDLQIPLVDLNVIRKLCDIIGISPDKVKAATAFCILLSKL
jgi:hypothetical protein